MARDYSVSEYYTQTGNALTAAPLTLSAWVYFNGTSTVGGVFGVEGGTSEAAHGFGLVQVNAEIWGLTQSPGSNNQSKKAISSGVWTHVLAEFVSSTSRFVYVNGVAGTEDTTANTPTSGSVTNTNIGGRWHTDTPIQFFDGRIGECAAWNVANLTAGEKAALVAGYSAEHIRPANLVKHIPGVRGIYDRLNNTAFSVAGGTPRVIAHHRIIMPRRRQSIHVPAAAAGGATIQMLSTLHRNPLRTALTR